MENKKIKPIIDLTEYNKDEYLVELGDYEFVLKNGKTYFVRKQPQFPKTYEDCCKVLNIIPNNKLVFSNPNEESEYAYRNLALYNAFDKLKVCRDAYWKIVGDWKPNWEDDTNKYVITNYNNHIILDVRWNSSTKLSFPTEEMRDAFYENFKELIEECKELL